MWKDLILASLVSATGSLIVVDFDSEIGPRLGGGTLEGLTGSTEAKERFHRGEAAVVVSFTSR